MTEKNMIPIPVGARAPDFTALNERGEPSALSNLVESTHLLLIFYPADWGFICRNEVVEFRDRQPDFERMDTKLVGISTNSVTSHGVWSEHLKLRFPLISDPPGDIAAAYGVLDVDRTSFNFGRTKRALFFVGKEMIVRYAWVTENQWLEPDYDAVLAACAEALNSLVEKGAEPPKASTGSEGSC